MRRVGKMPVPVKVRALFVMPALRDERQAGSHTGCARRVATAGQRAAGNAAEPVAGRDPRLREADCRARREDSIPGAQVAEAAEQLRGEIAELKAQGESDWIGFRLQLAGVRNVKAALVVALRACPTQAQSRTRARRSSTGAR